MDGLEQVGRFSSQRARKLHDIYQADVALAPFYSPHIISVQIGQLCQFFLRKSHLNPEFPNPFAEGNTRI
jgi:hypothetical protein